MEWARNVYTAVSFCWHLIPRLICNIVNTLFSNELAVSQTSSIFDSERTNETRWKIFVWHTAIKKNNLICLSITVSRSTTLIQHNHSFHYNCRKYVFISLNIHTSDSQHMIWTTKGHMFWATNRHVFCTTNRRNFEANLKQIRGTCFMNEHRKHVTSCQKPVAAEWPRMETSRHAYTAVVRCHNTRQ